LTEAVFQDWGRRRDERQRRRELQELVRADLADICRQIEAIVGHLAAAGFRISDFGFVFQSAIRNPQSAIRRWHRGRGGPTPRSASRTSMAPIERMRRASDPPSSGRSVLAWAGGGPQ
jgi:hypothetical protein